MPPGLTLGMRWSRSTRFGIYVQAVKRPIPRRADERAAGTHCRGGTLAMCVPDAGRRF